MFDCRLSSVLLFLSKIFPNKYKRDYLYKYREKDWNKTWKTLKDISTFNWRLSLHFLIARLLLKLIK